MTQPTICSGCKKHCDSDYNEKTQIVTKRVSIVDKIKVVEKTTSIVIK